MHLKTERGRVVRLSVAVAELLLFMFLLCTGVSIETTWKWQWCFHRSLETVLKSDFIKKKTKPLYAELYSAHRAGSVLTLLWCFWPVCVKCGYMLSPQCRTQETIPAPSEGPAWANHLFTPAGGQDSHTSLSTLSPRVGEEPQQLSSAHLTLHAAVVLFITHHRCLAVVRHSLRPNRWHTDSRHLTSWQFFFF